MSNTMEEKLLTMPRGLKLFYVDYIDEDDGGQYYEYVVGRTYYSALNRWYKEQCKYSYRFAYYFFDVEDEKEIHYFVKYYGKERIKAGIYNYR